MDAPDDYRAMFEHAVEGIFRTTPAGRYLAANATLARMYGYDSPQDLIDSVTDIARQTYVDPARRDEFLRALHEHGEVREFENRVYRKDGSIIWVLANARLVRDAGGAPLYFEGNVQDISARKEAEEAHRLLVNQSLQGIAILQDERFVFVNPMLGDMIGCSEPELLAMPARDIAALIHPDDRQMVLSRLRDRTAGRAVPSRYVWQLLRCDGGARWVEMMANRIEYRGKPAVLATLIDITERKRAQDQMQANAQRAQVRDELMAALARAGSDPQAVFDTLARVVGNLMSEPCLLMLIEDRAWLCPVAFYSPEAAEQDAPRPDWLRARQPLEGHPFEGVAQSGETALIDAPGAGDFQTRAMLVAPLRAHSETLGLLVLAAQRPAAGSRARDLALVQELADRAGYALQNARQLQQLLEQLAAERARQLHALSHAEAAEHEQRILAQALTDSAAVLNSTLDYERVLDRILEQLARVVPYETGSIFLFQGDAARVVRARGYERYGLERWIVGYQMPADVAKLRARYRRGEPIIIPDTRTSPEWVPVPETNWIRSYLSAPIRAKDEIVGMINLDSTRPGFFTAEHAARLTTFAHHAGIALENARLHAESERRAREREALYEITRDLATHLELPELLGTIIERAMALLSAPRGAVYTWDRAAHDLELVVQKNASIEPGTRLAPGEGLAGRVAQTREPLVVDDYEHWAGRSPQVDARGLTAMVGVPMLFGGELIGVLIMIETDPARRFTPDEVRLLTLFAAPAASAVRSAQLFRQAEQRAHQLALVYDAGVTLNRALDLRTQLRFLFQLASRALRADQMSFFRFDPRGDRVRFETGIGLSPEDERELRGQDYSVAQPKGLIGYVAAHRIPVRAGHPEGEPPWQSLNPQMQSALCVPVEYENELRGVLIAVSARPAAFTAPDERLLVLFANQVSAAFETARLLEEEQQRATELEILREASLAFASSVDADALLAAVLDYALRLVTADNAVIYLYEPSRDQLTFGAMLWAKDSPMTPDHWEPRRDGLTYRVARSGQRIAVADVNADPLFASWQWGGGIAGLPIRSGDTVRAVLNVAHERPHRFDSNELRALDALCDQAAVALDNVQHVEVIERRLNEARLLHESGEALNRILALDEILRQVAHFLVTALQLDTCTISMWQVGQPRVMVLYDQDPISGLRVAPGSAYAASDFPYLEQLDRERQTQVYRRVARDERGALPAAGKKIAQIMDEFCFVSFMVLPLVVQQEMIGFVELGDRQSVRDFTTDEIRLAESLTHQAASALLNAQLYEQAQRRAAHFQLVTRIAELFNQPLPVESMFEKAIREIAETLGAERGTVAIFSPDRSELIVMASHQPAGEPSLWGRTLPLGNELLQRLIAGGQKPLAIADAQNDPRLVRAHALMRELDVRAVLIAPLGVHGQGVGTLGFASIHHPRAFQPDEMALVETVAFYMAMAIDRAQLVDQVRGQGA